MKQILPLHIAVWGTLAILSCTVVFHVLVMAGMIPYNIVWGGKLSDTAQRNTMEAVSIGINLLMMAVVLSFDGKLRSGINQKIIRGALWLMFGLFLLNTLGNLMAENRLETYIFTPLTLVLALFSFRMAAFEQAPQKSS